MSTEARQEQQEGQENPVLKKLQEKKYAEVNVRVADLEDPQVFAFVKQAEIDRLNTLGDADTSKEHDRFKSWGQNNRAFQEKLLADPDFAKAVKEHCETNNATLEREEGMSDWGVHYHGPKGRAEMVTNEFPVGEAKVAETWSWN